ncbi:MAG: precorrin-6A reductase [Firmicutes bacterium]|nr:precorrin-6A reductase [Bacillota bacterium]MDD6963870.1 precorrin-6A reductase [Bacillota bacterium]
MKKVLVFAGTTEGRELAELLADSNIKCSVCVATDYALELMNDKRLDVHCGRLTEEEMEVLMRDGSFDVVVDATHPYAQIVSQNVRQAADKESISLIRLRRSTESAEEGFVSFKTHEECSAWLSFQTGNILLTTGSKDLGSYAKNETIKNHLFVRVLPGEESIRLCTANGITGRQIIAMQGPFSAQMNECILREYSIDWMVTKISGHAGGFEEKVEAAKKAGVGVCAILPPSENVCQTEISGDERKSSMYICENVYNTAKKLELLLKEDILSKRSRKIILSGIGMGNTDGMTREAYHAFEEAEVIFGAERMLENLPGKGIKVPYYRADDIISYLIEHPQYTKVAAAFSGDSGFYSGAQSMKKALEEANEKGILKSETTILPGISSVSALAARLGVSWNDAVLASIHGRRTNVVNLVRKNTKVFLLLSGKNDFEMLVNKFREAGINHVKISAGYRLSYPDEKLFTFYLDEFETKLFDLQEGVYTCLIENEDCEEQILTPGIDDEIFSRTKVPMTKNEVRVLSISRLELTKNAVVYDVGSGTGSVSIECARLSPDIFVFAIEQKEEAANLTKENAVRLGLSDQIVVINKKAPEGFEELPTPTHVFIGGSSGALSDILSAIQKKLIVKENTKGKTDKASKGVRVVINAVSLETIAQITKLIQTYPVKHVQLTQIQASRAHKLGSYNLMQAQNPVLIASFNLLPGDKMEADE